MSAEVQNEIQAGMREAFELGMEKGRMELLKALNFLQTFAVPAPVGASLLKSFSEDDHPRDDNGRFVSKADIAAAADDPEKAKELHARVTDPEEKKKLSKAIGESQDSEVDNKKKPSKNKDDKKPRRQPRMTGDASLSTYVRRSGGIDPQSHEFLRFHSGVNEAMEYGVPLTVFRKGGFPLDIMAMQMHENGLIHTPEGKDHSEHLMEQLAKGAKSALADTTAEMERVYYEHERNRYLASLEHSDAEIESAIRLGEEAGNLEAEATKTTEDSGTDDGFGEGGNKVFSEGSTEFDFGANEQSGDGKRVKPKAAPRRAVEKTVAALTKIAKRDKLTATDMQIITEAITSHTHAEISEVKKQLGIKTSGSKAKQAADIASRILDRDKSDARKFNHPHLTVDEAKAHIEKFVNGGEPKPGDAVRLANALAGGLTTKQLVEIKKHYGIKASGAKSEMASKIAQRLAPKMVNDWSEQDAKLNAVSETEPVKPEQQPQATEPPAPDPTPTTEPAKDDDYIPHEFEPREEEKPAVPTAPGVSIDDIPLDIAIRSHRNTSFVPERRGRRRVNEYVEQMNADFEHLNSTAKTPEQKEQLLAEFERYKNGYRDKTLAVLHAGARTASPMITGGSGFPVDSNRKRMDTQQRRIEELIDYRKKALKAIHKKINPATDGPILSNDPQAVDKLQKELEQRTKKHDLMKAANKIVAKYATSDMKGSNSQITYKAGSSRDHVVGELTKMGLSEETARDLLRPDYMGRLGFPGYAITNNGANMRRIQQRIGDVGKMQASPHKEESYSGDVTVTHNPEAGRIQIKFPGKPEKAKIDELKRNGFRWSPSAGTWQRHLNNAGIYATENTLSKFGHTKVENQPVAETPQDDEIEIPDLISKMEPEDELPEPEAKQPTAEPAPTPEPTPTVSQGQSETEPQQPARATDLFGNPLPKTWAKINSTQLDIEDQLKTAWIDHAHDFAKESGHKVSKIYAGGQFEANGKRYRVGLAEEGYPIHNDETGDVVRAGKTSGPVTNIKPQASGADLESKLKGHVAEHLKQSAGKASKSERNTIPGSSLISDASRDTRDNAERSGRVASGTADAADVVSQLGGPNATKSQLATRLAKFGVPEKDAMAWIDSLPSTGNAKTGTKQKTYDTLDVAKRLGLYSEPQAASEPTPQAEQAPAQEAKPETAQFTSPKTSSKAPHEMTHAEWDEAFAQNVRDNLAKKKQDRVPYTKLWPGGSVHSEVVRNAHAAGHKIPPDVLNEYPDLKAPHEQTQAEYDAIYNRNAPGYRHPSADSPHPFGGTHGQFARKNDVQRALVAGKPVPPEVLADYPDLQAKQAPQQTPAPSPEPEAPKPAEQAPPRRTLAYEGQDRPEHARQAAEATLTAEHATNPQHWDALANAGKRDWLIAEAKRRGVGDEAKKMPARKIVELLRKNHQG